MTERPNIAADLPYARAPCLAAGSSGSRAGLAGARGGARTWRGLAVAGTTGRSEGSLATQRGWGKGAVAGDNAQRRRQGREEVVGEASGGRGRCVMAIR